MNLITIDHITINCIKVPETCKFYEEVFGLERVGGDIDMGDHIIRYYQLPGGTKLELLEYKNPQKLVQTGNTDIGVYRHFAVKTTEFDKVYETAVKLGYGINLEPQYIPQIDCTVTLLKDPNGVEIEVIKA